LIQVYVVASAIKYVVPT